MAPQGITRIVGNRKGIFTRDRQPKMAAHYLNRDGGKSSPGLHARGEVGHHLGNNSFQITQ